MSEKYIIQPIEHLLSLDKPSLHMFPGAADWPSKNLTIEQKRMRKRWGYLEDRDVEENVHGVYLYQEYNGTRHTLYLGDGNLHKRETAAGKTWSYKTETLTYTSKIASISAKTVTLVSGETPAADGVADGDYFILTDDYTAAEEPHRVVAFDAGDDGTGDEPDVGDTVTGGTSGATGKIKVIDIDSGSFAGGNAAGSLILTTSVGIWEDNEALAFTDGETAVVNGTETATWASIASSEDTGRTITLDADYAGTTGTGWTKTGYVRQVYTTPSSTRGSERWQVAVVADKFCFTNGDVNVQYWAGSNYAAALDSTYATKAKYCIEYGNRLCLANLYIGGVASPWTLRASANGDPTKFSTEDTSAVDYTFIETDDVISGLGKVGAGLVVYKTESLIFGQKTAKSTDPFIFLSQKRGVGCVAPYSIVEYRGTNAFLGRDDFYKIDGDHPVAIGERIRYKFKEIVSDSERENVWGFNNYLDNEILWFANTSEGPWVFVYDYKDEEWGAYWYADFMSGAGRGAV